MSRFDDDVKSSRKWLVDVALYVLEGANQHSAVAARNLDTVAMVTACANLPDEMALRVRCTPHVFTFKA